MARAIVRFSIEAGQVRLRNQVRHALQDGGFTRIGTSSYEAPDLPLIDIAAVLNDMVTRLSGARLDHLWIYVDVPEGL